MNLHPASVEQPARTGADGDGFASHYVVPGDRGRGVLLICDHARNALPERYGTLGLPDSEVCSLEP